MYYEPPHEVRDKSKLQSMIDTLRAGGQLPPVIVNGEQALTGSHRLAAWAACGVNPQTVEISDKDYIAAVCEINQVEYDPDDPWKSLEFVNSLGLSSHITDYNDFCAALYKITRDKSVKAALEDQRD